ncbi:MAG: PAS domain-containing protein [Desulfobacterales bacterium]|uniref:histidine kinase n=1 Tax=Candidatus Desulfatibia vada TaxID=2841696 RepID=A0A8J6TT73_9BACT|nr:PAS domain-containing protein [Candidatus Desulfatibia vada]
MDLESLTQIRTNNIEREIAERIQVEEALRESEEDYKLLIKNLPGVVYRGYRDWSVRFLDSTIKELTGYDFKEFNSRKMKWSDVIVEEDLKTVSESFRKALKTGKSYVREYRIKTKDGSTRWIQDRGQIVHNNGGERESISGVFFDITERKQVEKERSLLATAIEQAAESVIISARPGTIQYVNPAFEQLSGFTRKEIVGKNFRILKSDRHDESFYKAMWDVISSGEIWSGHITNRMKDDTLREFETKISPVRDSSGEVVNFVSVSRDVTQEVALQVQLQQAQKMQAIGTLAGGIAHDFNNILAAVIGYTEIAIADVEKGGLLHDNLQEVLKAGERAKDLVNQILTFSRQSEQDLKPIKVELIVKEVLKLIRASLPATIEIHQKLKSETNVMGDPTKIHQVLMNLCTNAAHAMRKKGGVLNVSLADVELDSNFATKHFDIKPGPYLKLSVTDTGHGMPPGLLEHIFDPFFTTKQQGEGTGMGLSMVHGIVKSHGGTISVYSEPGEGSIFNVYLPAIESRSEQKAREEKPVPTGTERILFVDDEQALVNMGKQLLESLGYKVTTRTSSIEALKLFKVQPDKFDLVITDLTMPNMTGDELAQKLMAVRPDIPVILCTGFSTKMTEEKTKKMGIRAFVLKPVIKQDIAETIRKVLP